MTPANAHIIAQLQKDILLLHSGKQCVKDAVLPKGMQFLKQHLPMGIFPTGAVHELLYNGPEDTAATNGFISGLLSSCVATKGVVVWITAKPSVFPAALQAFTIEADNIIFIHPSNEKELLWVTEEALKCDSVQAVVAEIKEINFTNSRRLQLAVEKSKVTGFVLTHTSKSKVNACVSRWIITSLPSDQVNGLPGVGYPRWNVELKKMRNGKPGCWQIEWANNAFREVVSTAVPLEVVEMHKRTG